MSDGSMLRSPFRKRHPFVWAIPCINLRGLAIVGPILFVLGAGCSTCDENSQVNTRSIQQQHLEERNRIYSYMEKLTSKDTKRRNKARLNFKKLSDSSARHLVQLLIDAFHEGDGDLRRRVVGCLAYIGPRAVSAVPLLIEQARDEKANIRRRAAFALSKIGPAARDAIPSLIEMLRDSDSHARLQAASTLRVFGSDAKEAVPYLITNLEDPYSRARSCAAVALGTIGPPAKEAVPHLIKVLESQKGSVLRNAIWALGQIGPSAVDAAPSIVKMLDHDRRDVRIKAIDALGQIRPNHKATILKLAKLVDREDLELSYHVVKSLELIGKPSVPSLVQLMTYDSPNFRVAVIRSLGNIGPEASQAIPALKEALDDHDPGGPVSAAAFAPRTVADWAAISLRKIQQGRQLPNN